VRFGGLIAKRWPVVGGALVVAAVGGLLWWSPWEAREPPEPVYDGKPISHWLSHGSRQVGIVTELVRLDQDPLMVHLFSEIKPANWQLSLFADPNAVPFLIKALRRDTWFGAALYRKQVRPRVPPAIRSHLPTPVDRTRARWAAAYMLWRMGPAAKSAVPRLTRLLKEDDDPVVRCFAAAALGRAGVRDSNAAAALVKALENKKFWFIRQAAIDALWRIDPDAAARSGVEPVIEPPNSPRQVVLESATRAGIRMPPP
jgi:hypothetical protein